MSWCRTLHDCLAASCLIGCIKEDAAKECAISPIHAHPALQQARKHSRILDPMPFISQLRAHLQFLDRRKLAGITENTLYMPITFASTQTMRTCYLHDGPSLFLSSGVLREIYGCNRQSENQKRKYSIPHRRHATCESMMRMGSNAERACQVCAGALSLAGSRSPTMSDAVENMDLTCTHRRLGRRPQAVLSLVFGLPCQGDGGAFVRGVGARRAPTDQR